MSGLNDKGTNHRGDFVCLPTTLLFLALRFHDSAHGFSTQLLLRGGLSTRKLRELRRQFRKQPLLQLDVLLGGIRSLMSKGPGQCTSLLLQVASWRWGVERATLMFCRKRLCLLLLPMEPLFQCRLRHSPLQLFLLEELPDLALSALLELLLAFLLLKQELTLALLLEQKRRLLSLMLQESRGLGDREHARRGCTLLLLLLLLLELEEALVLLLLIQPLLLLLLLQLLQL